jgi:protein phosphatase
MNIKISSITDIGKERSNNEDAFFHCADLGNPDASSSPLPNYLPLSEYGALSIVADGMGGANAGEVASSLAVESIRKEFCETNLLSLANDEDAISHFLERAFSKTNRVIMNYLEQNPESMGLGTTVVLIWLKESKAYIAWCGDSRCYCFNPSTGLKLLTKDHSYVQELIDKGEIKPKEAFKHPDNNIITRCLGDTDTDTSPEFCTYEVQDGDIFLLCSDGLSGYCKDISIERTLINYYENLDLCENSLLQMALKAGGQDNITISLCATLPDNFTLPVVKFGIKIKRFFRRILNI